MSHSTSRDDDDDVDGRGAAAAAAGGGGTVSATTAATLAAPRRRLGDSGEGNRRDDDGGAGGGTTGGGEGGRGGRDVVAGCGGRRRGRRKRSSAQGVDYKALAGETYLSDEEDAFHATLKPKKPRDEKEGSETTDDDDGGAAARYANRHVPRLLALRSIEPSPLQIVEDGRELVARNLLAASPNDDDDDSSSPAPKYDISEPILVKDVPESLGMRVPRGGGRDDGDGGGGVSVRDVADAVGHDHPVTVMDVHSQEELDGWTLGDLVDYFEDETRLASIAPVRDTGYVRRQCTSKETRRKKSRPRVLNQISLEFSGTGLSRHVASPSFVRDLDWIDNVWPSHLKSVGDYPRVQYYCLTSTAGCYTDFHVDFGGTTVWYHVLSGRKIFALIPPTETNLKRYEEWLCSKEQSETFYPSLPGVSGCVSVTLERGQTMVIPSGYVHAVYTPFDSVVIGGNFLHGLDVQRQLDAHCLETRTRVPAKFRFPHFVRTMFYAGGSYLERMERRGPGDGGPSTLSERELRGMGPLKDALAEWWKVQPKDGGGGGGKGGAAAAAAAANAKGKGGPGTIVRSATEAARRAGCSSVEEMLSRLEAAVRRLREDDGDPGGRGPRRPNSVSATASSSSGGGGGGGPKLKLSLKRLSSSPPPPPPPPPPSSTGSNSPKPKLKLRLGGGGGGSSGSAARGGGGGGGGGTTDGRGGEGGADGGGAKRDGADGLAVVSCRPVDDADTRDDPTEGREADDDADDADDVAPFKIELRSDPAAFRAGPGLAPALPKKKRRTDADLDPYRGARAPDDDDDDEWIPGGGGGGGRRARSRKKRRSASSGGTGAAGTSGVLMPTSLPPEPGEEEEEEDVVDAARRTATALPPSAPTVTTGNAAAPAPGRRTSPSPPAPPRPPLISRRTSAAGGSENGPVVPSSSRRRASTTSSKTKPLAAVPPPSKAKLSARQRLQKRFR